LAASTANSNIDDDLEWLVGRWRCVVRQYHAKPEGPLGSGAEDTLDYLNVYYPYADESFGLALMMDPEQRRIAAEFLVRRIEDTQRFSDHLAPMLPWGPVCIGKDTIRVGSFPGEYLDFHYSVERRGHEIWLILDSAQVHLELWKFADRVGSDISTSFVKAPIKDYSPTRIAELERRYSKLRRSQTPQTGPSKTP
jgi:hypothetical protein